MLFGVRRAIESSCIDWNLDTLALRLQEGWLPIACDSGGNVFCLSLRADDYGTVLYLDLESVFGDLDAVVESFVVAPSFSAFLRGLRDI